MHAKVHVVMCQSPGLHHLHLALTHASAVKYWLDAFGPAPFMANENLHDDDELVTAWCQYICGGMVTMHVTARGPCACPDS